MNYHQKINFYMCHDNRDSSADSNFSIECEFITVNHFQYTLGAIGLIGIIEKAMFFQ